MISHDLIVYSGMIHSSPERNIPDWNESFQTGLTYTGVVEKNPYWCYSEMLTLLGSTRGVGAIPFRVYISLCLATVFPQRVIFCSIKFDNRFKLDLGSKRSSLRNGLSTLYLYRLTTYKEHGRPAFGPSCTEFVFRECWHFDNDAKSKIDDVLTEHGGLLHVLPLAVHLSVFAGQVGRKAS